MLHAPEFEQSVISYIDQFNRKVIAGMNVLKAWDRFKHNVQITAKHLKSEIQSTTEDLLDKLHQEFCDMLSIPEHEQAEMWEADVVITYTDYCMVL